MLGEGGSEGLFEVKGQGSGVVVENVRTVEMETDCGVVLEDSGRRDLVYKLAHDTTTNSMNCEPHPQTSLFIPHAT